MTPMSLIKTDWGFKCVQCVARNMYSMASLKSRVFVADAQDFLLVNFVGPYCFDEHHNVAQCGIGEESSIAVGISIVVALHYA